MAGSDSTMRWGRVRFRAARAADLR
jgi:hypothetical protein